MTIETKFNVDECLWTIADDKVVPVKVCGLRVEFIVNPYTRPKIVTPLIKYNVRKLDYIGSPIYYEKAEEDLFVSKKLLINSL